MVRMSMLFAVALVLANCATPAGVPGMVSMPTAAAPPPAASALAQSIAVESVAGGEETSPMWVSKVGNAQFQEALTKSLEARGLYAREGADARFALRVGLVSLAQPLIGLDMTVRSSVRYTLMNRATQQPVYDRVIDASHTATFADAAIGVERLRLANEGSIRKNVEAFLADLTQRAPTIAPEPPLQRRAAGPRRS